MERGVRMVYDVEPDFVRDGNKLNGRQLVCRTSDFSWVALHRVRKRCCYRKADGGRMTDGLGGTVGADFGLRGLGRDGGRVRNFCRNF